MSRASVITTLAAVAVTAFAHPSPGQAPGREEGAGDARSVLAAEIAGLEGAIAALEDLAAWQHEMIRAASSDPAGTLRQRRSVAECRASPLAPVCPSLAALFRDDARDGMGGEAGAPAPEGDGEGAP